MTTKIVVDYMLVIHVIDDLVVTGSDVTAEHSALPDSTAR